jgi:hypothetical protein
MNYSVREFPWITVRKKSTLILFQHGAIAAPGRRLQKRNRRTRSNKELPKCPHSPPGRKVSAHIL